MWVLNAIIIHILWLGAIFVIYFQSPVIKNLRTRDHTILKNNERPTKRIVLIVTDGLRANSFFKNNCSDIPHIRRLFPEGKVAISRTRVPTESRPGHIALIAGLYEDPSAVTRGWKENPIDFDTVFNKSAYTYAWGANDVLHIFSRVTDKDRLIIDAYDHDIDFSGRLNTAELDKWVFRRVKSFLEREKDKLQMQERIIFFLHLLGLDSAGHIHKPDSQLFLDNLHETEKGIFEIYKHFEYIFSDSKTTYVLTSDHGMTNSGSHGDGSSYETDTPLFVWGAGIVKDSHKNGPEKQLLTSNSSNLPEDVIEQAQITPLISALLGISVPANNFGILPRNFMDVSEEYYALAAHNNAQQLHEQFLHLLQEFRMGLFAEFMPSFRKLNKDKIIDYGKTIHNYYSNKKYEEAMNLSYTMMEKALEGIDYYHNYYKNILLVSTALGKIGWMIYLFQILTLETTTTDIENNVIGIRKVITKTRLMLFLIGVFLLLFLVFQKVPLATSFYLLLPIFIWFLPLQQLETNYKFRLNFQLNYILKCVFSIVLIELMVLCFFYRSLISLAFLLFTSYRNFTKFSLKSKYFFISLFLNLILSVFPLLTLSVGYKNNFLLLFGTFLTLLRTYLIKSGGLIIIKLISVLGISNGIICIYLHSHQIKILLILQIISWSFLIYSTLFLFIYKANKLIYKVELIILNLSSIYLLLSTSYEPIVVLLLALELIMALSPQQQSLSLNNCRTSSPQTNKIENEFQIEVEKSFTFAFLILLYTFFSFFATGNISSISSFDPNIIRCFISTFSPFIIMFLIILKLIIPVFILISIIFGTSEIARTHLRSIFISLLLICNFMGLNFLFLVRNQGSWLEIGSSISHYVIMQVTTVILLMLTFVINRFILKVGRQSNRMYIKIN